MRIRLVPPLGYLDFLSLMAEAKVVLTDSGGIQEETTILGIPCITLRENTERPATLEDGTNVLAGSSPARIVKEFTKASQSKTKRRSSPKYWDGNAAKRILKVLRDDFCAEQSRTITHWERSSSRNELTHN